MIIPNFDNLSNTQKKEVYIKLHYPEFYQYIINTYPNDISWREKLYWYQHNIKDYPTCIICGKKTKMYDLTGYRIYCCPKCASKDNQAKIKHTCLERYGVDNYTKTTQHKQYIQHIQLNKTKEQYFKEIEKRKQTCLERYGAENYVNSSKRVITMHKKYGYVYNNIGKRKQTCLERYGAENFNSSKEFQNNISKVLEKRKQTNLEKYGVPYYSNVEKRKQTNLEKYGVKNYSQTQECKNRIYNTKKINHTFNTSSIEQQFKKWLDDNKIEYKYQYKSKEYPFVCDFYFPLKDLYLEIQGSWTHGGHPFDPNNEEDIKTLNKWKEKNTTYYNKAIETWTIRDVKKREIGKNLNWIEVFSVKLEDIINIHNSFQTNL